jgi:hypothetical protein
LLIIYNDPRYLYLVLLTIAANLLVSRGLLLAFYKEEGIGFAAAAAAYYLLLFPLAVGAGGFAGLIRYLAAGPHRWNSE